MHFQNVIFNYLLSKKLKQALWSQEKFFKFFIAIMIHVLYYKEVSLAMNEA